jgi:hypothetical protein
VQTAPSRRTLLLVSGAVIALLAIVAISLQREVASEPKPQLVGKTEAPGSATTPSSLTTEEEAFAAALWPLHQSVVEPSTGRLTYAGLTFAIDDPDPQRLAAKLRPLRQIFHDTQDEVSVIPVPASLQQVRDRYTEMLSLYEQSATEMLEVVGDGNRQHLIDAQLKSENGAEELVRLGDILWPGEHKPN